MKKNNTLYNDWRRVKIINFLYSLKRYTNTNNYCELNAFTTESQFNKIKEFMLSVVSVLSEFREENHDYNINNNRYQNYQWLLEGSFQDSAERYVNIGESDFLPTFQDSIRDLLEDEIVCEKENNISDSYFKLIDVGEYFLMNNIRRFDEYNSEYSLESIDIITLAHIDGTYYGSYAANITYKKGNKTVKREVKITYDESGRTNIKILRETPRVMSDSEKTWLRISTILSMTALKPSDLRNLITRINLFIEDIDRRIIRIRSAEYDDIVNNNNLSEEDSSFEPLSYIDGYSHRTVSIPIMGNLMGVKLEFKENIDEIFKFKRSLERLHYSGWLLEKDQSVTFELKSPIMDLAEIQKVFIENNKLFQAWANITDSDKAGLHFHVSMDDCFSVNKRPASKTKLFVVRLAQMLETTVLKDGTSRKVIFKRDYQSDYCGEYGDNDSVNLYRWINFLNLDRDVGKTIEIRLFSASAANELDKAAEKALLIVKLFKYALKDWRAKDRPEFTVWQQSFGDTKIFKALFSKEERKRWVELFTNPVKNLKTA